MKLTADTVLDINDADAGTFAVTTARGTNLEARNVVLATGMRDELPPIEGLRELWGTKAASCPFCHGYEYAGSTVAFLGDSAHADRQVQMLESIGITVRRFSTEEVARVEDLARGVRIHRRDGAAVTVDGIFLIPDFGQRAPFPEALGLEMQSSGAVRVGAFGETNVAGVFAAGDMAQHDALPGPIASVVGTSYYIEAWHSLDIDEYSTATLHRRMLRDIQVGMDGTGIRAPGSSARHPPTGSSPTGPRM